MKQFSDSDIVSKYKIQREAHFDFPGICAEEYQCIMDLIIKHLFNWDCTKQESNGIGIFSELLAWCLATEEQGRKCLHGHYLVFIKNWQHVLNGLQLRMPLEINGQSIPFNGPGPYSISRRAKDFYSNCCSSHVFADFELHCPLSEHPVFEHVDCHPKQKRSTIRYCVLPTDKQCLREMHSKTKWKEHQGQIASCQWCGISFSMNEITQNALNTHLGCNETTFVYPETEVKWLDKFIYNIQKDFHWPDRTKKVIALCQFVSNALTNIHHVSHATRCFKKGNECYANLPNSMTDSVNILYNEEDQNVWTNWCREKGIHCMFQFQPHRPIEDAFTNTHNLIISNVLGCNSNVMVSMNGCCVLYVTGYNTKSQQKDERVAFEKVSKILIKQVR